jgi:outer membrane lipopolysaccharide assembly protein LptE/RlpB
MRWRLPKHSDNPRKRPRGPAWLLAAPLALAMVAAGCGYHVAGRGAMLPKTWHTLSIPVFANHTLRYRLGQRFTQAVVREFEARTSYRIVPDPRHADAVLHGDMTSIEAVPVLFDSTTGRATTMLVTVHLKVRLEDRTTKKISYRNDDFVFRDEYELSTNPKSFFEEENPALDRMARDLAARLVSDVLENF